VQKEKGGGAVLGRRKSRLGRWADCAREEKEKKAAGLVVCGLKGMLGRRGEKRGRGRRFSLFFNSFQIRFSNFQTSNKQKSMHSNHDAQTLIISKLF
jgi:hypothetical protein